ncbi:DUF4097 family beta strand repeat-containing protein [Rossellomorea aquimaris]|uniref:DUF4097 family beta strand repeat-containing protein n=1 Tax=Rossellomorea aquimaris TaxID=189382 RepID=UPI001CD2AC1A|nr:DUF4097 domain-containing protein [Rossellomorea aquimaris]MCA1061331.1 DUF4097 family beta strand repeat-containing protein [Rossellomorea aquimaris]
MNEERKRILDMLENGTISAQEALALLEALDKKSHTSKKKEKDFLDDIVSIFQDDKKGSKDDSTQTGNPKDKLLDFMNSALTKIKNFDFDFQWNQSVELSHVFQQPNTNFEKIDVDVANGKVELIPWDGEEVRVECEAKVYRTEDQEEARKQFMENTSFAVDGDTLYYSTQLKWMKVDAKLYIPKHQYKRISVRLFNGGLSAENLEVEDLRAKAANGKIHIDRLTSKKTEVETSNGAISILNAKADHVEAESINGKVHVEGDILYSDVQSLNGNIICDLTGEKADTVHAKTVTGNIDLFVPENINISGEAKSNFGSFKVELQGMDVLEEKNEVVQKSIRFSRKTDSPDKLHLFAETKAGSVLIKKHEQKNVNKDNA